MKSLALWFTTCATMGISMGISSSSSCAPLDEADDFSNGQNNKWKPSFYYSHAPSSDQQSKSDQEGVGETCPLTIEHQLYKALRNYRELSEGIVKQISMAHEVASRSEATLFPYHHIKSSMLLSHKLEEKISKTASLLEQNAFVLEHLLRPFPVTIGLSPHCNSHMHTTSTTINESSLDNHIIDDYQNFPTSTHIARYIPPYNPSRAEIDQLDGKDETYNTASYVITHIARDWTASGAPIREDAYDWIVDQLWKHHSEDTRERSRFRIGDDSTTNLFESSLSPVLVPGAGVARLAFDIAFAQNENAYYPFQVEANDNSLVMAAATYHLFGIFSNIGQDSSTGHHSFHIYPIVSDPFVNEIHSERRWEPSMFPEKHVADHFSNIQKQQSSPKLSYAVGDFVATYALPEKQGMYGAITTCFFIDTATNIYEYVLTIRNLLKRHGGVWINLGPVQWHHNAMLQPSVDELKGLILLAGFEIKLWEISDKLLAYRHVDDLQTGTRAEAYRSLRFVVTANDRGQLDNAANEGSDLLSTFDRLRGSTGAKPVA